MFIDYFVSSIFVQGDLKRKIKKNDTVLNTDLTLMIDNELHELMESSGLRLVQGSEPQIIALHNTPERHLYD